MSLMDRARADFKRFIADERGFGVLATFTSPTDQVKTVRVLHSKHHITVDNDGRTVNSKNGHISFAESEMTEYTIRNDKDEVSMKNHKVTVKDSTGLDKNYKIRQAWPNETLGIIVCILDDLE